MFESQITENKSSVLGNHFRVFETDLLLMRETCTGKVNYHKVPEMEAQATASELLISVQFPKTLNKYVFELMGTSKVFQ